MWSDKETTEDLLGYTVHASLLKSVVTNDKNLPITVGLYGDWGSGKTSILKILEEELKNDNDTVVVYFDGWSFESFDDAKMALIQGIVDALEKDIRYMMGTTWPTFSITLIVFLLEGIVKGAEGVSDVAEVSTRLRNTFCISPWLLLVPVATGYMIYKKLPSVAILFLSVIMACVAALIAQPERLLEIAGTGET